MPDSFGNPTPQEVQQLILQQQQARLGESFAQSPSGFGKVGVGIGNALGGLFNKNKKDPAVEKAEKIQEVTRGAQETLEFLTDHIGVTLAEAAGWNNAGRALKKAGLHEESLNAFKNSVEIKNAEEERLLGVEQSKATLASTRKTTERADTPLIVDLQDKRREKMERLAQLELATAEQKNPALLQLNRQELAEIELEIHNMGLVLGSSDTDAEYNGLTSPVDTPQLRTLQTKYIGSLESLDRMKSTAGSFKPDFLRAKGFIKAGITKAKDFAGLPIDEAEKKFLQEQSTFMRDAFSNLNLYIKEITGAQMSFQEAARLGKGIPDPSKDGPIEYRAKLIATTKALLSIQARTAEILRTGDLTLMPDLSEEPDGTGNRGVDYRTFEVSDEQVEGFLGLTSETVRELETAPVSTFTPEQLQGMSLQDLIDIDAANKQ